MAERRRDIDHPFYRPLWRRIAIVVVVALWATYEITLGGDGLWLVLSVGSLAYAVWAFLITYDRRTAGRDGGGGADGG